MSDRAALIFSYTVPLAWPGLPWQEGTTPTAWLGEDGKRIPSTNPAEIPDGTIRRVATFSFRLFPTMRESIQIERNLDELNNGIGETVDLDQAIQQLWRRLRDRYEAQLWPDGRPKAGNNDEARAQEALIDALYRAEGKDRAVIERMTMLRDRQRLAAEWPVLRVETPPGWEQIGDLRVSVEIQEAVILAHTRARLQAEADAGK